MPVPPRPSSRGVDTFLTGPRCAQRHYSKWQKAGKWALFRILCLLFPLIASVGGAAAGAPVQDAAPLADPGLVLDATPSPQIKALPLSGHMEVLDDPDGALTIDDVLAAPHAARFHPTDGDLGRGYTADHVWVRITFRLRRPPADAMADPAPVMEARVPWMLELGPLYLDHITAYSVTPGHVRRIVFGDQAPADDRPYKGREFLLPLTFDSAQTLTLYLDIHSTTSIVLHGWAAPAYTAIHALSLRSLGLGVLMGIAIAMMAANLVYALWLRDRNSLVYCGYIANLIILTVSSTNMLVEINPAWAALATSPIHGASLTLLMVTATVMGNTLLNLRKNFPLIYRLSWPLTIIPGFFGFAATLAGHFRDIAPTCNVLIMVMLTLMIGCAIRLALRGSRVALLVALSFFPSCAVSILGILGRLEIMSYIAPLDGWFGLAGALHMVLMNFAIAYRVRQLEIDRQAALASALNASQTAGQQAKELVALRTRELAASNSQLSQALTAERQAVKEQLQFIDMVSHEYRTPVAILRTAIDVLFLHIDLAAQELPADLLTRMRRAVDRLVEIIEVGLRLDGPQSAALSMLSSPMDLRVTVGDAIQGARQTFPDRVVTVRGPDALEILGDPDLLKTALLNVLGNALKYSPAGSEVRLDIIDGGGKVQIRVRDHGPGIPGTDQERVFQKFVRLSQTQRIPGTGLGLFMVRRIAELHDGRAYIDPTYTEGCCLVIDLPSKTAVLPAGREMTRMASPSS